MPRFGIADLKAELEKPAWTGLDAAAVLVRMLELVPVDREVDPRRFLFFAANRGLLSRLEDGWTEGATHEVRSACEFLVALLRNPGDYQLDPANAAIATLLTKLVGAPLPAGGAITTAPELAALRDLASHQVTRAESLGFPGITLEDIQRAL